jgi:hypothetical protein
MMHGQRNIKIYVVVICADNLSVYLRLYFADLERLKSRYSEYARFECMDVLARQLDRTDAATNLYLQSLLPNVSGTRYIEKD